MEENPQAPPTPAPRVPDDQTNEIIDATCKALRAEGTLVTVDAQHQLDAGETILPEATLIDTVRLRRLVREELAK